MSTLTTIPVAKTTRDRLKRLGDKGQTYDEIVRRLLEEYEAQLLYERQRRILETSEFTALDEI